MRMRVLAAQLGSKIIMQIFPQFIIWKRNFTMIDKISAQFSQLKL